jgi:hypothetical protein
MGALAKRTAPPILTKREKRRSPRRKRAPRAPRGFAGLGLTDPVVTSPLGRRFGGIPLWVWATMGAVTIGGAGILLFTRRGNTVKLTEEQKRIFIESLPLHARQYGPVIIRVAEEQGVSPFAIFALGDRETLWGTAKAYKNFAGDWSPRSRGAETIARKPGVYRDATAEEIAKYRLKSAAAGHRYVLPSDGLGWGRGLMQIDYEFHYAWLKTHNWRDAYVNVTYGTTYLAQLLGLFGGTGTKNGGASIAGMLTKNPQPQPGGSPWLVKVSDEYARWMKQPRGGNFADPRPLTGTPLVAAAVAAYNTGPGNVIRNLALGLSAEASTTGGDYTADTIRRRDEVASRFTAAGGGAVV